jgi:hypothetical protein
MVGIPLHSRIVGMPGAADADLRHMPAWGILVEEKARHGTAMGD